MYEERKGMSPNRKHRDADKLHLRKSSRAHDALPASKRPTRVTRFWLLAPLASSALLASVLSRRSKGPRCKDSRFGGAWVGSETA